MLRLNVVTPERSFLKATCESITLPGKFGELMILLGHTPSLIELKTGTVTYTDKQKNETTFMIADGFVEVDDSTVNVLCELAKSKEEVDKQKEEEAKKDLMQKINKPEGLSKQEENRLKAELERSMASLRLFD